MKLLESLRIRTRVAVALVLPLIAFVVLAGQDVLDKGRTTTEMADLQTIAVLAGKLGAVIHEAQRERGLSAIFLGSEGKQGREAMEGQRRATDAARQRLDAFWSQIDARRLGEEFAADVDRAKRALGDLASKRQQIDARSLRGADSLAYYNATVDSLLGVTDGTGKISKDVRISYLLAAYVNYMRSKDKAGQERALGAVAIGAGIFQQPQFIRFVQLGAEQATFLDAFMATAPEAIGALHKSTVTGKAVDEVARMRNVVLAGGLDGVFKDVDAGRWYDATTARVDLMKQVEDRVAAELEAMADGIHDAARNAFIAHLAMLLAVLAVTLALGTFIIRSIARPVAAMTGAMTRLAAGDTSIEVTGTDGKDEIAAMARAVLVFKDSKITADRLAAEQKAEQEAKERRAETMAGLTRQFDGQISGVVETVSSAATQLQSSAGSLTNTAERTSKQSVAVAAASEQASANVQTVATAAEELTSSIGEISRQVAQSAGVAKQAVEEAQRTRTTVDGLSAAAQKIGDVLALINDIAAQTNLLALNATIEAARAGEAGKGFAVVAGEVKSLANQTARATEDISGQVGAIQTATNEVVQAMERIAQTIGQINEIATTVASAVEEQGAATQEIARNVQEAATGTRTVSSNIAGVTEAAGETGRAGSDMLKAANALSAQSDALRKIVVDFLGGIRAA